ncbi:hypothetical protein ACG33_00600 [Steroidobacter denitrificans]|uniref:DUF3619 family protein n=1 Tax=Steroidobacter denitrificans TaxID=465721 RepID=A0A127F5A0_STEDE|nr:hypothetical protein [Steroidobacter denitrificans]AMN45626.1 hypothetical protein ACG33_00600 [Steroidobacter denitrificans]
MVNRCDHESSQGPGEHAGLVRPQPEIDTGTRRAPSRKEWDAVARRDATEDAGPDLADEALADAWQRRARSVFDDGVERVDARIRSKLTQARYAAVDELRKHAACRRLPRLPVAGLTVAAVAAVAVLVWNEGSPGFMPGELPLEDMELVAEVDSLEMLQDVEFYAWLGYQR